MARIIIDYPDDMSVYDALEFAKSVVRDGRVSEAGGVRHFCWVSHVKIGPTTVLVQTRRKKVGQKSDSLLIKRSKSEVGS